jgi:hypothetical protein
MSILLKQSFEAKLSRLESLNSEYLGEPDSEQPLVCATCYELSEECFCVAPVMWPLSAVVLKLRSELALYGTA